MKPFNFLALTFLSLSSLDLEAKVISCVFDGGGTVQDRACGSERAVELIQGKYKGVSSDIQVLSGSGKNGDTECMSPAMKCNDGGEKCSEPYTMDNWDAHSKSMTKMPIKVSKTSKIKGNFSAGTKESFQNSCMAGASKQDVCHMWTVNHGAPTGIVAYNPGSGKDKYITPADVRAKADQCGTFRYFTQSCYGSQLGAVILDDKGKLIPGRCGIAASPAGVVAPGILAEDGSKAQDIKIEGGNHPILAKVKAPVVKYPMLEMMAKDKSSSIAGFYDANRDTVQFDHDYKDSKGKSQHADLAANTDFYMSSDYYLDEKFGKKMASAGDTSSITYLMEREKLLDEAQAEDPEGFSIFNTCPGVEDSTRDLKEEIEKLLGVIAPGQVLNEDDKKAITDDLRNEYRGMAQIQSNTCSAQATVLALFINDRKTKLAKEKDQIEKDKLQADLDFATKKSQEKCDFNQMRIEYKEKRKKFSEEYLAQKKKEEAAEKTQLQTCIANNLTEVDPLDGKPNCRDLDAFEKNLRVYLKTHCTAPGFQKVLKYDPEVWNPDMCDLPEGRAKIKLRNQLRDDRVAVAKARADSIKMDATVEEFLSLPDSIEMRSYESRVMRLNRILGLYRKGSPENVKDYLMLRECEKGDINKPVVSQ